MKKLFLLFILCIGLNVSAQISTSEEEYNYLTKGYPQGIENGLDIKKGYTLDKINSKGSPNFELELFSFSENGITKAYLITKKANDKIKYYCLPINNAELWRKYNYDTSIIKDKHFHQIYLAQLLVDALQNKK